MRRWWHFGWAAVVVVALLLHVIWPSDPQWRPWATGLIAYPVAAALILASRPRNTVGRLLAVVAVTAGVVFITSWVVYTWHDRLWSLYLEAATTPSPIALFWGAISLLYFFPTGSIPQRFARRFFAVFTVVMGVMALVALFVPGPLAQTGRPNPWGGPEWLATVWEVGVVILLPGVGVGIWSTIARRRKAGPAERAQMKWFVTGIAAVIGLVAVVALVPENLPSPYEQMLYPVVVAGFWALPAAIVVAITRYRLYEIDRIVSRTVAYGVVVALLAVVFSGVVVGLQALLPTGSSSLAVAGSTLLVAAGFNPLRRRVQRVVERRFNRSRYDAAEVVARVAEELRDSADMDVLVARTREVVAEVFAPSAFAVWIVDQDT
jgi:hypothetical protein